MGVVTWIIFGAVAGYMAKFIMPGKKPSGCLITIILGITGAFVGGYIATVAGIGDVTGFNIGSLLIAIAIAGAALILYVFRKLK